MTTKIELQKTYNSKLSPNKRKELLLKNTFQTLKSGANVVFDFLKATYGAITPSMLDTLKHIVADYDKDLICATNWFRPVLKSEACGCSTLQPLLLNLLTDYLGHSPNELSVQYISSPIGEDYEWMDCNAYYKLFVSKLGVSLDDDVRTLIRESFLPLKDAEVNGWSTISSLFGEGVKEDREVKRKFLYEILRQKEKITSRPDLKQIVFDIANVKNSKDFKKIYEGGAGGSPSLLVREIGKDDNIPIEENKLKNLFKNIVKTLETKEEDLVWKHNKELKNYFEKETKLPYHHPAYSQMWQNALSDIVVKNTRNYNFSVEQLARKKELELNQEGKKSSIVLNKYFESKYFTTENKHVIRQYHVGENSKNLFELLAKNKNHEECVEEYCTYEDNGRVIKNLLLYICSLENFTNEMLESGLKYLSTEDKITRQKINPTVKGNLAFTFGGSALNGEIISPIKAKTNNREDSLDCRIWTELELLDNGEWVKHHIPFYDIRFFEEVYAIGTDDKKLFRTKRFGCDLEKVKIPFVAKKHVKTRKRLAKIENAIKNNKLPKADWNNCSVNLSEDNGNFYIAVSYKFKVEPSKKQLSIGDTFVSFDLNVTAPSTYSVFELTDEFSENSKLYEGFYVKVIETGKVESITGDKDQLNYDGLKYGKYSEWHNTCRNFMVNWQYIERKTKDGFKKVDLLSEFDGKQSSLYNFNAFYAGKLREIIKGKSSGELQEIRTEIIRFITGSASVLRVSSLSNSSLVLIKKCSGLLQAYFAAMLGKISKDCTDEDKKNCDEELFLILEKIRIKDKNKRREKEKRIANSALNIAIKYNAKYIILENLGGGGKKNKQAASAGNKKNSKKQNAVNANWLSRGIFNKLSQMAPMHSINIYEGCAVHTSHQDTFENTKENPKAMKARFGKVAVKNLSDYDIKNMSNIMKNKNKKSTTSLYYLQAMEDFINHYNLSDYNDIIKNGKIKVDDLKKILSNHEEVYIPKRGGRWYFSTHNVTTGAEKFTFNGKECYLSDSDDIAAVNIGLVFIRNNDKKFSSSKVTKTEPQEVLS